MLLLLLLLLLLLNLLGRNPHESKAKRWRNRVLLASEFGVSWSVSLLTSHCK
jgi:hypothetical protein